MQEAFSGVGLVESFVIKKDFKYLKDQKQKIYKLGEKYYQEQGFTTSFEEEEDYDCLVARNENVVQNLMIHFFPTKSTSITAITIDDGTIREKD